jgi:SAM-dependent methyltransferase
MTELRELRIHIEGGDLLQQDAIRSTVREIYSAVEPTDRRVAERFYPAEELAWLPDQVVRSALGVGNPVSFAELRPGEDVVDLGSGGGIDCLLAARAVGPTGSVIGVDFLEDAVSRARAAAVEAGLDNVRFLVGEAWAGCLSGALSERAMYTALRRAGFRAVSIEPIEPFGIDECALYPLFTPPLLDLLRRLVPADRLDRIATSALLRARKPAPGEPLPGRAPHDLATAETSPHP